MLVISDTTPVRYLAQVGKLELLHKLYGIIIIPSVVEQEVANSPYAILHQLIVSTSWLEVKEPSNMHDFEKYNNRVDEGEKAAIALACELKADLLLIDDLAGKNLANELNIPCIGLAGVALRAKKVGLIPLVMPFMLELKQAGFWVGDKFLNELKKLSNE
jgi:uncharacterized protein